MTQSGAHPYHGGASKRWQRDHAVRKAERIVLRESSCCDEGAVIPVTTAIHAHEDHPAVAHQVSFVVGPRRDADYFAGSRSESGHLVNSAPLMVDDCIADLRCDPPCGLNPGLARLQSHVPNARRAR